MKSTSTSSHRQAILKHCEKGGFFNYPATVTKNPQGGIIVLPYFDKYAKSMVAKGQREHSGWGYDGPAMVTKNPQGGIVAIPIFGPTIQKMLKKTEASKKPETPKKTKMLRPKKGHSAHKTLHDTSHPILAEAIAKILGKTKKREADSNSTAPPIMKAKGVKRESKFKIVTSRFMEGAAQSKTDQNKFRVVLLEEGMGNSHDAFYYTKDALESAVDIFKGLKIMADHPTMEEEDIRPERSTRDILGHYENLSVEEGDGGQHQLCGDVDILPSADCEWARARMSRAIENSEKFPGRDFIGLSINASGPSQKTPIEDVIDMAPEGAKSKLVEAQKEGIEFVRVVNEINRAVSCDLVTEAGAGGKVLNALEGEKHGQKRKKTG